MELRAIKQSHVNFKANLMACRHIRNTLKVIIQDFKIFFANLVHTNGPCELNFPVFWEFPKIPNHANKL